MEHGGILKALPSYNSSNFSKFQPNASDKKLMKKASVYISTDSTPPQQVIKKDRSNILLRYLYQQLDKKNKPKDELVKRKLATSSDASTSNAANEAEPQSKVPRQSERLRAAGDPVTTNPPRM